MLIRQIKCLCLYNAHSLPLSHTLSGCLFLTAKRRFVWVTTNEPSRLVVVILRQVGVLKGRRGKGEGGGGKVSFAWPANSFLLLVCELFYVNLIASVYAGKHAAHSKGDFKSQYSCPPPSPSTPSGRQECPRGAPKSKKNLAQFPNAFNSANPPLCFLCSPSSHPAGLLIPVLTLSPTLLSSVLLSLSPVLIIIMQISCHCASAGAEHGAGGVGRASSGAALFVGCLHNFPPFIVQLIFVLVAGSRFAFA